MRSGLLYFLVHLNEFTTYLEAKNHHHNDDRGTFFISTSSSNLFVLKKVKQMCSIYVMANKITLLSSSNS